MQACQAQTELGCTPSVQGINALKKCLNSILLRNANYLCLLLSHNTYLQVCLIIQFQFESLKCLSYLWIIVWNWADVSIYS